MLVRRLDVARLGGSSESAFVIGPQNRKTSSDPFARSFKPEPTQLRNQLEHKSARNASTASDFAIDGPMLNTG